MEGLPCFVCAKKVAKPCVECGFIWYCGDACRERDLPHHESICDFQHEYAFCRDDYRFGKAAIIMVHLKRANDTKYETETKLCKTYLENPQSLDALVVALGTCTEPNEYLRSDMANVVKWLIYHIDPDNKIRTRIAETNRKKKLEEEKLKQIK
jgi:hypothetical protein